MQWQIYPRGWYRLWPSWSHHPDEGHFVNHFSWSVFQCYWRSSYPVRDWESLLILYIACGIPLAALAWAMSH